MVRTRFLFTLALFTLLCGILPACSLLEPCRSAACADDARISSDVQAQLRARPALRANRIDVQTIDHVVYLSGQVDSDLESRQAEAIASDVPDVKRVVNMITVLGNAY